MTALPKFKSAEGPACAPVGRVVVFDEDPFGRQGLCRYLEAQGFATVGAGVLADFMRLAAGEPVNLVVFKAHGQAGHASSLCRHLSQDSRTPLIVITPGDDDLDRILCLELGADDVLVPPVNSRELLARMRAVLRRRARPVRTPDTSMFRFAGFRFDPARRELWSPSGAAILLTGTEANLLRILLSQGAETLGRLQLAQAARVASREGGRALDLHVSRLRRKLEDEGGKRGVILTHRSLGYRIAGPVIYG